MPPRTGVSVGWLYSGHWPQARQAPGTGPFLDFQGWGHPGSPQPPPHPERSGASDSAKGPGAVRFRGKGPQVGAAVAECEWFRWEITGDNPAQDGAARQETSSREPAAGWVGGGVPLEAQSFGLLDPKLCYLLDGILFIYGVIVTALYLRAKFSGSVDATAYQQGSNQLYNELSLGRREEYDVLDKKWARDPEVGGKQALQKDKMAEAYSEIGMKGEGLSTATKDTYDALNMQTLPPR
ncbi:CD247 antigen [Cricetulus griseus]